MSLPAIPDPSEIDAASDPAGAICALVGPATEWLARATDLSQVNEARAKASAIETYARAMGLGSEARRSAIVIELRASAELGRLMPERTAGRGKKMPPGEGNFSSQERSKFRTLDKNRAMVEQAIAELPTDKLSPRQVLARIERQRRQNVDETARTIEADVVAETVADVEGRWAMHPGDMDEVLSEMAPQSVDAIVTDPPYPAESLPLWLTLAGHASRLLVPDGLLIALTGQILLPAVMTLLDEHLTYGWMYCQPLPGARSKITGRNIDQAWKPWLVYSTGTWPSGRIDWHADVLDAVAAEKGAYSWQQSVVPAMQLINALVPKNGVVLDPFTGSGSYGEAALTTGRRFIGIEADAERFKQASERLAAL